MPSSPEPPARDAAGSAGDIDVVADELYGLALSEFTTTRDARARAAQRSGDRELAAAIKKLRRPTTSAWLTNLLVRQRHDLLEQLLGLGAVMREAQAHLAADDLRQLSRQRHQAVVALRREAVDLARRAGLAVSTATARELEGTLEAAMAGAAAGDAVRAGRLTQALQYSGLGAADDGRVDQHGAAEGPAPPPADAPPPAEEAADQLEPRRRRREIETARRNLQDAQAAAAEADRRLGDQRRVVAEAHRALDADRDAVSSLEPRLEEQRREVADLERQLDSERARAERAAAQVDEAEVARAVTEAERQVAEDRVEEARRYLDDMEEPEDG